ncbi:MAG TPA: aconitate hydratase AcnA, partial [Candidatus Nesterenkonia stercoripullorum]|nr:aconitate hydratase AcnA [Candidatus Nesterenkonia stercoripullorum]
MSTVDSFGAKGVLDVNGAEYEIFRLNTVEGYDSLPYSLKVLLENLLRSEDGANVTAKHIEALGSWDETAHPDTEIQFTPGRVLMQDFTGVPCVVDLATMREAVSDLGGDPAKINPLAPAELVIDHSVQIDSFGSADAIERNMDIEYQRNGERYGFLRWGQTAFDDFKVVPPGMGIVHQVNIENLARVVMTREVGGSLRAYPDTCVGTDSHTTMENGLGVLGWGVGGIEAEAAMLGQPISMLIPRVVGFKLSGEIPAGATATDVVLTITQMLREHGVVGKFVEFYGEGVAEVPLANRATIGNMSPEFGSTAAMFPIDDVTIEYLRLTGRPEEQVALVEAYAKEQGMWHDPSRELRFSEHLELDLSTVVPSISGPKRPQDRIELSDSKEQFRKDIHNYAEDDARGVGRPSTSVDVETEDGRQFELDHGAVSIASITSCTNTSNPNVMLAAAVLARNAVNKGLAQKPWVKTSVAPGSKVVTDYYEKSGLIPFLEKIGFYVVGYGCTTCIGNSGPLEPEISQAIQDNDLSVTSVLSGNRNFEGRINPDVKMNYLASPPLVVAYALAGTMDFDFENEPLGQDDDGNDVFLSEIWPDPTEVQKIIDESIDSEMFTSKYDTIFDGDHRWQQMDTPQGTTFDWDEDSTYVRKPPYFDGMELEPEPVENIHGARVLLKLGDSITTDHISPAGSFKSDSPAGKYLL